jgi:hypothetical protein
MVNGLARVDYRMVTATIIGGLKNDYKHGFGVMKFADGRIFEGEYINGQMIEGKNDLPRWVDVQRKLGRWYETRMWTGTSTSEACGSEVLHPFQT